MAEDFYGFDDDDGAGRGKDNLFLWTIFILLLIGLAAACWLGSFYIFGHPEDPKCYKILKKLKKLEAPKRFEVTAAPPGEFKGPQAWYEKYSKLNRLALEEENGELIRNYLKNFRETKKLTPYLTGRFNIIDSYPMKSSDMFTSGVVVLAQAIDFPQVLIEHVYPTAPENVATLQTLLQTGLDMKLEKTNDLSAIIHIQKVAEGRLQFTLVPLLYGTYALKQGVGTFNLEPPAELNMVGGVPLIKEHRLKDALAGYARYRRDRPIAENHSETPVAPTGPELVRVDTVEPGTKTPETGPMPAVPVATPIPLHPRTTPRMVATLTTPRGTPRSTPITMASLNTPRPIVPPPPSFTPRPVTPPTIAVAPPPINPPPGPSSPPAAATPMPRFSPTGVPLQPFIAAAPAPSSLPMAPGASWRTYSPGQIPSGRSITPAEATAFAGRGDLGERLYLRGDFRVTASGENRAVLRDRAAGGDPAKPSPIDGVRIIVEFPAGAVPPEENATFTRDSSRPFEIRDVRKGADGQVNIYVREITAR